MGQEFIIKSQALEDKINQLLPSQGGFQAGVDLSVAASDNNSSGEDGEEVVTT